MNRKVNVRFPRNFDQIHIRLEMDKKIWQILVKVSKNSCQILDRFRSNSSYTDYSTSFGCFVYYFIIENVDDKMATFQIRYSRERTPLDWTIFLLILVDFYNSKI